MAKCVLCEKEIGDLEESSLHQCNMLRYNKSSPPPDVVEAARRLADYTNYGNSVFGHRPNNIETVCKWVLREAGK